MDYFSQFREMSFTRMVFTRVQNDALRYYFVNLVVVLHVKLVFTSIIAMKKTI